jgi:hypothetical protein
MDHEQRRWDASLNEAREHIKAAMKAIDELSRLTEDAEADMRLCYAGNGLQGPLALLREADTIHRQLALPLAPGSVP